MAYNADDMLVHFVSRDIAVRPQQLPRGSDVFGQVVDVSPVLQVHDVQGQLLALARGAFEVGLQEPRQGHGDRDYAAVDHCRCSL